MRLLTEQMGIKHHITLAYSPWANGAVEIVNSELLWTVSVILSELKYTATDWNLVTPLVQYILNGRVRDVLNGKSPIEVMTTTAPKACFLEGS